ncbi:magnesium ion transporter [Entomophthora muscae]|uniref:Magnesium ion transporter n=1 Tax=Entomophthora muscae TaxID=34485 RepID=A0ACC2SQW2_9FUNG|nr:magnesium ion transporter [Entomophthora muscae]
MFLNTGSFSILSRQKNFLSKLPHLYKYQELNFTSLPQNKVEPPFFRAWKFADFKISAPELYKNNKNIHTLGEASKIFSLSRSAGSRFLKPNSYSRICGKNYVTDLLKHQLSTLQNPLHSDLKLRCTEFDHNGNVRTIAGEFSKPFLCSAHGLQPRDLRKIDSTYANQMPAILVREQAILVNLLQIRALIKSDLVILFDSIASNSKQHSLFIYDLQERLRPNSVSAQTLPLEFRALESILVSVVGALQSEMEGISSLVSNLLAQLEDTIDRDRLKLLLTYSKRLSKFEQKVLNIRGAIEEVLEQDEDLCAMYLTCKKAGTPRSITSHDEIELLLETYLKQTDEIANVIGTLRANVRTTEDIVNIILDSQRNSLLLLELQVTMCTLGLTMGAFIASIFGMNLTNHLESHQFAFYALGAVISSMVFTTTIVFLRRMRRLVRQI